MKTLASILVVASLISTAHAECFMRSSTVNQTKGNVERIADISRDIVPVRGNRLQCTVTFRVMIDGRWYTAEGQALGNDDMNENQLCAQAQDIGRAQLLQRIDGSRTSVNQETLCTDKEIPEWRPVKVGDIIRESQVGPHWDLNKRQSFAHQGMECRWFSETVPYGTGGIVQSLGIMCKLDNGRWLVRDKWINSVDR